MTRVTVVIPAYNAERYIEATFDSLVAQTLRDFEVVLIDDGSTDSTLERARRYTDQFALAILQQRQRGPSAARNAGIRQARGRYCAFLDADDLLLPGALAAQAARLDADPEVAIVATEVSTFNEQGTLRERRWDIAGTRDVFSRLLVENYITTSAVMARVDRLIEAGLFPEDRRVAEDYELWLELAVRGKLALIEEPLVRYRYTSGSLSSNKLYSARCALDVIEQFWRRNPALRAARGGLYHASLARHIGNAGDAALAERRWGTALPYFLSSLRHRPLEGQSWKGVVKLLAGALGMRPTAARA